MLVITCFCDRKKAKTGNILNITNLQYGNNREVEWTVIFATQMIVLASIEGHGLKFSKSFCKYFSDDEKSALIYYHDIEGLIHKLKPNCYKNEEWRLLIDSSTWSSTAVLLQNSNEKKNTIISESC